MDRSKFNIKNKNTMDKCNNKESSKASARLTNIRGGKITKNSKNSGSAINKYNANNLGFDSKKNNANKRLQMLRESLKETQGVIIKPHSIVPGEHTIKPITKVKKSFKRNHETSNDINTSKKLKTNILDSFEAKSNLVSPNTSTLDEVSTSTPLKPKFSDQFLETSLFKSPAFVNSSSANTSIFSANSTASNQFKTDSGCDVESMDCDFDEPVSLGIRSTNSPNHPINAESSANVSSDAQECQSPKINKLASIYLGNQKRTAGDAGFTNNDSINKSIYVVTDTNVFIHHLDVIVKLMSFKKQGLIIYIPYQTLRELDWIKDGRMKSKSRTNAQIAVNYISEKLESDNDRMQGQSVEEALTRELKTSSGDDSILSCCIQLSKSKSNVVLLTEDKNLRNKAHVSKVKTSSYDKIFRFLQFIPDAEVEEDPVIGEISSEFSLLCSYIISRRLHETCGDNWKKKISTPPPWTIKQCLRIFIKFWNLIAEVTDNGEFSELGLGKYCRKAMTNFLEFLDGREKIGPSDINAFIEFCRNICLFFCEGLPNYEPSVQKCLAAIKSAVSKGS